MNLKQINEFRVSQGLVPIVSDSRKAEKSKRQNANRAARAAESRELKAVRNKGGRK